MQWLDANPNVVVWASEELIVGYISPVDKRAHRYFPDFLFKIKDKDGKIQTIMGEIKPHVQSFEPAKGKKKHKTFIKEIVTYGVNEAKWRAAQQYCAKRGWEFRVITEKNTPWIIIKKG